MDGGYLVVSVVLAVGSYRGWSPVVAMFYTRCRRWWRFLTPVPFWLLFLGCFVFIFSVHNLHLWCSNITGLFIGIGARSAIFYLLIVLKCKEWFNAVHVMFVFCLGYYFKSNLSGIGCREFCTSILCNLPLVIYDSRYYLLKKKK
jgi:hypothetical protein